MAFRWYSQTYQMALCGSRLHRRIQQNSSLSCNTNIKASTVLSCFRDAVAQWGLPSRIRSNRGGENIDVLQYMIHRRGTCRGSALVGRYVHNQWKERLWRNVNTDVPELFKSLFTVMEDRRILDSMSESDF